VSTRRALPAGPQSAGGFTVEADSRVGGAEELDQGRGEVAGRQPARGKVGSTPPCHSRWSHGLAANVAYPPHRPHRRTRCLLNLQGALRGRCIVDHNLWLQLNDRGLPTANWAITVASVRHIFERALGSGRKRSYLIPLIEPLLYIYASAAQFLWVGATIEKWSSAPDLLRLHDCVAAGGGTFRVEVHPCRVSLSRRGSRS
jgi:hypothetical protein